MGKLLSGGYLAQLALCVSFCVFCGAPVTSESIQLAGSSLTRVQKHENIFVPKDCRLGDRNN